MLLCLGVANILARAGFQEVEDGVLWREGPDGVVVAEIAEDTPAMAVGLAPGDVLLAIDDRPIQTVSDVVDALHATEAGTTARYTILRLGTREVVDLRIAALPNGARPFYFLLASIGIFTLLVGGAVRLQRPRDPATLHFFWLSVAFFGLFTFSFSGRLDRLDWVFYWGDALSILLLPALFLHFTLVFPQRSQQWATRRTGRVLVPLIYAPALALGAARVIALARSGGDAPRFMDIVATLDRLEYIYLVACFAGGLFALTRALAEVRSITARRQLRWIAWGTALGATPFVCGYAVPWAMGVDPSLPMQLSVIPLSLVPLAYASAIVRYRLLDVEVIVKRTLGYSVALAVVAGIYAGSLQGFERVFSIGDAGNSWVLAGILTVIALLLVPPVKQAIHNALDRAFYRDRYDYRRALVGFARDLNSDLDLNRLAKRLVSRVTETLFVDRMALMLADGTSSHFGSVRSSGFADGPPAELAKASSIGARLCAGHSVTLDDPIAASRFEAEDVEFWRDEGLYHFVPCVSAERTIALLAVGRKSTGESLNSEDTALLAAVAGQIATALENARLYRQLHDKAIELDRVRMFNENILESLDDGLMVTDLEDHVLRWNSALEQLYGISRGEAVGRRLRDLFEAPVVEAIRAARRDAPEGTTLSRIPITLGQAEAARTAIVNATVVPLRASDEQSTTTVGTIVILEDVTRRVELEEQLQISEKMASIGLLAAGVAHEVNTPLTGISSFTQMLLEGADPEDPRTQLLKKIENQTSRAGKIVSSLLKLSRAPSSAGKDLTSVDLNKVINDVLALLEHQFELQSITLRRELWPEPVIVAAEEHKLQQVFLNLFLNAKDAMPTGGWLSVSTSLSGDKVTVELADTGSGIPSEYLARIYDPFFTTKAIGQGTGLGLSITYGIVREHLGSIDCESAVGRGTRFLLAFPSVSAGASVRAARS